MAARAARARSRAASRFCCVSGLTGFRAFATVAAPLRPRTDVEVELRRRVREVVAEVVSARLSRFAMILRPRAWELSPDPVTLASKRPNRTFSDRFSFIKASTNVLSSVTPVASLCDRRRRVGFLATATLLILLSILVECIAAVRNDHRNFSRAILTMRGSTGDLRATTNRTIARCYLWTTWSARPVTRRITPFRKRSWKQFTASTSTVR